jgi:hypothetical protein
LKRQVRFERIIVKDNGCAVEKHCNEPSETRRAGRENRGERHGRREPSTEARTPNCEGTSVFSGGELWLNLANGTAFRSVTVSLKAFVHLIKTG